MWYNQCFNPLLYSEGKYWRWWDCRLDGLVEGRRSVRIHLWSALLVPASSLPPVRWKGTALLSRVCPCCSASLLVSKQHNQLIWPLTEVLYSESQNKDFQPKYCFSQKFWATQHRLAHFLFPISQPLPSSSLTRTLCTSIYMSLATSKRTSRLLLLQPAHCTYQELHFCGDKEEPKKILIFGDLQGQVLWGWLRSVVCHLAINLHLWDSVSPVYGHTSAPLLYKPPLIQPSFSR